MVLLVGLTRGEWARATFGVPGQDSTLDLSLYPGGRITVASEDPALVEVFESPDNEESRAALTEAIPGTTAEFVRVLAVLVIVITSAGLVIDLTPRTWVLLTALSLSCLVTTVILRDEVLAALATEASGLDLGPHTTRPTGSGALAVGGSVAACLAAAFAAGPRPVEVPAEGSTPPSPPSRRPEAVYDAEARERRLRWFERLRGRQRISP